jgi:prevent-host-death family protein
MAPSKPAQSWPLQDAKARFSELVEVTLREGPQIVTRRGVEAIVLVPVETWRQLEHAARPSLKDLLLAESPRADIPVPSRRNWRRRPPTAIE